MFLFHEKKILKEINIYFRSIKFYIFNVNVVYSG